MALLRVLPKLHTVRLRRHRFGAADSLPIRRNWKPLNRVLVLVFFPGIGVFFWGDNAKVYSEKDGISYDNVLVIGIATFADDNVFVCSGDETAGIADVFYICDVLLPVSYYKRQYFGDSET
jgi:hypothetical protein